MTAPVRWRRAAGALLLLPALLAGVLAACGRKAKPEPLRGQARAGVVQIPSPGADRATGPGRAAR